MKTDLSSPVVTAEFSKFAGILSANKPIWNQPQAVIFFILTFSDTPYLFLTLFNLLNHVEIKPVLI